MKWIVYRIAPGAVTHRVEVEAESEDEAAIIARREIGIVAPAVYAVHDAERMESIAKGQPCSLCGECCRARQCALGVLTYGEALPCPGLLGMYGCFWCRPLLDLRDNEPRRIYTARFLAIGEGCGWRR